MGGIPTSPSLKGYNVRGKSGTPTSLEYPVDATSPAIRIGDPVKEVAGGIIRKALVGDTAILGFAAEPNDPASYVEREIAVAPVKKDASGRVLIRVHVADTNNVFMARTEVAPVQGNVTKAFDLKADATDAAGFVIANNSAVVTALCQIQRIVQDVQTLHRVEFQIAPGKSQYLGVAGA